MVAVEEAVSKIREALEEESEAEQEWQDELLQRMGEWAGVAQELDE